MVNASDIKKGMEIVGADEVHLGIIAGVEGDRIKMERKDPAHGTSASHSHFIPLVDVISTDGNKVWISGKADLAAWNFEQEESGKPVSD